MKYVLLTLFVCVSLAVSGCGAQDDTLSSDPLTPEQMQQLETEQEQIEAAESAHREAESANE